MSDTKDTKKKGFFSRLLGRSADSSDNDSESSSAELGLTKPTKLSKSAISKMKKADIVAEAAQLGVDLDIKLTKAELIKLLENFSKSKLQAAILAIPMSDTLKLAEKHTIQSTINRENVWRALTPQLFSKEALKFAYNSNLENLVNLTDEASLFDNLDIEVMIIEGSSENIKITFKEDLKLVENILINQKRIKS